MLPLTLLALSLLTLTQSQGSLPIRPAPTSYCNFWPDFGSPRAPSDAKAEVVIINKTTEEKSETGQGLQDNLLGECKGNFSDWSTPAVLAKDEKSGKVTDYAVWFDLGPAQDPGCIERAIQAAEAQDVLCEVL